MGLLIQFTGRLTFPVDLQTMSLIIHFPHLLMDPELKSTAAVLSQPGRHTTQLTNKIQQLSGISIALMIATATVASFWPAFPTWPSGLIAWFAAALLVSRLSTVRIIQIGLLLLIGLVTLVSALSMGADLPWLDLLDSNVKLLSMLAAVSFLKLVAMKKDVSSETVHRGPFAFQNTVLAVTVLGSFINISAPVLIGDRLTQKESLSAFTAQSITRAFSGCAAWSPFFAGMAVVVTYVTDTNLLFLMSIGVPFALTGLLVIILEARIRFRNRLNDFAGYPLTISSLQVPVILGISVLLGYLFLPRVSILIIIALAALAVCILMLVISHGTIETSRCVTSHILYGLPDMVGELLLFLAAGILAVGLRTLVAAAELSLPFFDTFDATTAGILLGSMIVISALGAHPIISIAVFTPLLAPINPDPQLLANTYLFGWSLGTCASPLSATHLLMQSRFGISSIKGAMRNWPFVGAMYLVSLMFLKVVSSAKGL